MDTQASQPIDDLRQELEQARARARDIERELLEKEAGPLWQLSGYYGTYYAITGALLGLVAAMGSLLFNIIGSLVAGKNAFELIRIYLTFPLGEKALTLLEGTESVYAIGDGMIVAIGCSLYLFTGMLIGIPITMGIARFTPKAGLVTRIIVATLLALGVWAVNFYVILAWLQPLLFGGNWILTEIPTWVAAATHVVFGLIIAILYPLAEYHPYSRPTEQR